MTMATSEYHRRDVPKDQRLRTTAASYQECHPYPSDYDLSPDLFGCVIWLVVQSVIYLIDMYLATYDFRICWTGTHNRHAYFCLYV